MKLQQLPGKLLDEKKILIISVFIAGLCSLIYELLISTASSYFLGDSVKQFSITIGLYMAAMGGGSYLSRLFTGDLLAKFIFVEILLGFLGGISIPLLYFMYAHTSFFYPMVISMIIIIGVLTGLEVPLLARIMEKHYILKFNLSNVLSLDYLGALMATLLFPFIFLPFMGTFKSSLFFGIVNMGVGFINLWYFSPVLKWSQRKVFYAAIIGVTAFLGLMLFFAQGILESWSNSIYEDRVIYRKQTPYQRLVMTKNKKDIRLYINGNLQFSSIDEYRYHEPLVHIPMGIKKGIENVLLLGGGDGLAVKELLKYPNIKNIGVVDLDSMMFHLAKTNPHMNKLNKESLQNSKVTTYPRDAMKFLTSHKKKYDLIISDLPDPNNVSLARLYSREFYKLVHHSLNESGIFVTQATSPFYARKAFSCIYKTLQASPFRAIYPYHTYVPSFGEWGFVMASKEKLNTRQISLEVNTRYLREGIIEDLFQFPKDIQPDTTIAYSTIDRPKLLDYYLEGWQYWY